MVEILIVAGLYLFAALIMFYPFAPLGKLSNSLCYGDALQFTFFHAWCHHALLSGHWGQLFDLPISHPLPMAGGLTDILPGLAVLTLPLRLFTSNPVLIYNLTTLALGMLNGLSLYLLARSLGAAPAPAFSAGFIFAFNGLMIWHAMGHLSVLSFCFTPLALLCLARYLLVLPKDDPGHRADLGHFGWGLAAVFFLFLQGFASSRLGIIALIGLGAFALFCGPRGWRGRPLWQPAVLAVAAGVAVGAVAWMYQPASLASQLLPCPRSIAEVASGGVDILGYFVPNMEVGRDLSLPGRVVKHFMTTPFSDKNHAYLGWTLYSTVAACGVVVFWRKRRLAVPEQCAEEQEAACWQPPLWPWFAMAAAGAVLGLGPILFVGGKACSCELPWMYFVKAVPPLVTFRSVGRLALLAVLGLSVLYALLLTRMSFPTRRAGRLGWKGYGVCALLTLAAATEFFVITPVARLEIKPNSPVSKFLASLPAPAANIQLPYPGDQAWLLDSIPSFQPTVNSFSGGLPNPWQDHIENLMRHFPDASSIAALRQIGVSYVIDRIGQYESSLAQHEDFERKAPGIYFLKKAEDVRQARSKGLPLRFDLPEKGKPDFGPEDPAAVATVDYANMASQLYLEQYAQAGLSTHSLRLRTTGTLAMVAAPLRPVVDTKSVGSISLRVRFPNCLEQCPQVRLYWKPVGEPFSEPCSTGMRVEASSEWQVVRFPLQDHHVWNVTGPIEMLRVDPFTPSIPDQVVELDQLRFEKRS